MPLQCARAPEDVVCVGCEACGSTSWAQRTARHPPRIHLPPDNRINGAMGSTLHHETTTSGSMCRFSQQPFPKLGEAQRCDCQLAPG